MKLVSKLSLAITIGVCMVLGIRAWLRANEERKDFRADAMRDHALLSTELATAVEFVWMRDGPDLALDLVRRLNERMPLLAVKFVWSDGTPAVGSAGARERSLIPAPGQKPRSKVYLAGEVPDLLTYAPVDVPGPRHGALEIHEILVEEAEWIQRFADRMVVTTGVLVVLCAVVIFGFGVVFVARPLRLLVAKADRIGRGDLSEPLDVHNNDEIRDVALAINDMCVRLEEARELAQREEAARLRALEQLRHADRLRTVGELASGIAHQTGTPLNVVRVRGSMIANGEVSPGRMRELGAIIVDQVDKMGVTIRQLLDFARVYPPTLSSSDVGRMVSQSAKLVEPLANERGVQLVLDVPSEPLIAAMDFAQIHQALTNLIVNAIHASPRGESVVLSVEQLGAELVIAVRDHGEGIPSEQAAHIFEPFYTTKRAGEGTGLGLSVAQGIVREHDGRITVESEKGKGAVFRIVLPFKPGSRRDLPPVA